MADNDEDKMILIDENGKEHITNKTWSDVLSDTPHGEVAMMNVEALQQELQKKRANEIGKIPDSDWMKNV